MRSRALILPILISILLSTGIGGITASLTEEWSVATAVKLMTLIRHGTMHVHAFDSNGVPMVRYNRIEGREYYNPVYISVYALAFHDKWRHEETFDSFVPYYDIRFPECETDDCWRSRFLVLADWLRSNLSVRTHAGKQFGVWEYGFDWDYYGLTAPWTSGMAQGLGIQVLLRAYEIANDPEYLESIYEARSAMLVDVENGGVRVLDSLGGWWFEEYADQDVEPSFVLNGMEHTVLAIADLQRVLPDSTNADLLAEGLTALRRRIDSFDTGDWTYYDLVGTLANLKYHKINTSLTRDIYRLTGDPSFDIYETWEEYDAPFLIREFIWQEPNYSDIGALLIHVIGWLSLSMPVVFFLGVRRSRTL